MGGPRDAQTSPAASWVRISRPATFFQGGLNHVLLLQQGVSEGGSTCCFDSGVRGGGCGKQFSSTEKNLCFARIERSKTSAVRECFPAKDRTEAIPASSCDTFIFLPALSRIAIDGKYPPAEKCPLFALAKGRHVNRRKHAADKTNHYEKRPGADGGL